ncbi:choline dehydrogenase-like protein [Delitschia confertaspora ATCC 74209]|uniref:Choline dehydrogenase-like protein n=1 Tax=Delitschia confertaspora ATCC 74209 TaxID=1513339 RepID=A0A9P4JJR5_9PLEO|nr:choline dehydrogenase-like protein [Delitschia confertaspora ATCC 74209]
MLVNSALVVALASLANALPSGLLARVVDAETASQTSYDFIIAGGGTSGLTVADRLTENPKVSVLVIEYGPFDQKEDGVLVPGAYFPVPYLWLPLFSTPQTALNNTVYGVPCGRAVGGGSAVNAMFFHRSSAAEYDAWDDLGADGWDWDGLLPYFKKSETFHPPDAAYAKDRNITYDLSAHGTSGPVQASYPPYDYPGSKNFWNAALRLGIPTIKDPNAGEAIGIFCLLHSVDPANQTRSFARTAHYDRVISARPNYHVLPNTAVGKVTFTGTTATGVEYIDRASGAKSTAKATKEVIIAAGAVHSPQILQLSGIGSKSHLQGLGIKQLVNLPGVGQNLQDHLVLTVNYNYTNNLFPNGGSLQSNATYNAEQRALYDARQPSAYDITATTGNLIIFLNLQNTTSAAKYQSIVSSAKSLNPATLISSTDKAVLKGYANQRNAILNNLIPAGEAIGDISWNTAEATSIYMTRPLSRGSVMAASADPLADPLIDFGAGTDPTDIEFLLAIYKKNREIMSQPEIKVLGAQETSPAPGLTDDNAIKAALKAALQPSNAHECCTLAMMDRGQGGVVASNLTVYGTSRLSVVDASIWPFVTGGGPQATVYGGAEKAADIIKKRHGI